MATKNSDLEIMMLEYEFSIISLPFVCHWKFLIMSCTNYSFHKPEPKPSLSIILNPQDGVGMKPEHYPFARIHWFIHHHQHRQNPLTMKMRRGEEGLGHQIISSLDPPFKNKYSFKNNMALALFFACLMYERRERISHSQAPSSSLSWRWWDAGAQPCS